jgi:hypothetical protein
MYGPEMHDIEQHGSRALTAPPERPFPKSVDIQEEPKLRAVVQKVMYALEAQVISTKCKKGMNLQSL